MLKKADKIAIGAVVGGVLVIGGIGAANGSDEVPNVEETTTAIIETVKTEPVLTTAAATNAEITIVTTSAATELNTELATEADSPTTLAPTTAEVKKDVVYIAASGNGTKYHKDKFCSKMGGSVVEMSKDDAIAAGYTACQKNSCYG